MTNHNGRSVPKWWREINYRFSGTSFSKLSQCKINFLRRINKIFDSRVVVWKIIIIILKPILRSQQTIGLFCLLRCKISFVLVYILWFTWNDFIIIMFSPNLGKISGYSRLYNDVLIWQDNKLLYLMLGDKGSKESRLKMRNINIWI